MAQGKQDNEGRRMKNKSCTTTERKKMMKEKYATKKERIKVKYRKI